LLWTRLHWSSHVPFVQARAVGPFRAHATGVPQHAPESSAQPVASGTSSLHVSPTAHGASVLQGVASAGGHTPDDLAGTPWISAMLEFQYVT